MSQNPWILVAAIGLFAAVGCSAENDSAPVEEPTGEPSVAAGEDAASANQLLALREARLRGGRDVQDETAAAAISQFARGEFEGALAALSTGEGSAAQAERLYWLGRLGLQSEYFGQGTEFDSMMHLQASARLGYPPAAFDSALYALMDETHKFDVGNSLEIIDDEQFDNDPAIGLLRYVLRHDQRDRMAAFERIDAAASEGRAAAQIERALYLLENDEPQMRREAMQLFMAVQESGLESSVAAYYLGQSAFDGDNAERASSLLQTAANAGNVHASAWLGFQEINSARLVAEADKDDAYVQRLWSIIDMLAPAERSGVQLARLGLTNVLGELNRIGAARGIGIRSHLQILSELGYGQAVYDLAIMRLLGVDGDVDEALAYGALREIAELNHPDAAVLVAQRALLDDLDENLDEAVRLYRIAAPQYRGVAAYNLLEMVQAGIIEPASEEELEAFDAVLRAVSFDPTNYELTEVTVGGQTVGLILNRPPTATALNYYEFPLEDLELSELVSRPDFYWTEPVIQGYVDHAGGNVDRPRSFHFASLPTGAEIGSASDFEVRDAITGAVVWRQDLAGVEIETRVCGAERAALGCDFPELVALPADGLSAGVYYAYMRSTVGERSNSIFFTVYDESDADVVLVYPDYTWHAYSVVGGVSYYTADDDLQYAINSQRPVLAGPEEDFHTGVLSQRFARVLAEEGYSVRHVTNHDLHTSSAVLENSRLVLLAGHDEYWTTEIRDHLESYMEDGGQIAIFGGNIGWWLHDVTGDYVMSINKASLEPGETRAGLTGQWDFPGIDRPLEATFGLYYGFGGYPVFYDLDLDAAEARGITPSQYRDMRNLYAVDASHPVLRGLDLGPHGEFGASDAILDVEVDAAPFWRDLSPNLNRAPNMNRNLRPIAFATLNNGNAYDHRGFAGLFETNAVIAEGQYGEGSFIHFGSIGWYNQVATEGSDARTVFTNTLDYMLN